MGSLEFGSKQSRLCGFWGGESPPVMVLAKSTGRAPPLGLTHDNYCRVFSRGYNRPAVLGTCGEKGIKREV